MSKQIKPVSPPAISTKKTSYDDLIREEFPQPPLVYIPPIEKKEVNVSSLIKKINERLEPTWQLNELRGGRYIILNLNEDQLRKIIEMYSPEWEMNFFNDQNNISIIFKPKISR